MAPTPPSTLAITAATVVTISDHAGYLEDPYPVHFSAVSNTQYLSGTNQKLLNCAYPITAHCFESAPLSIALGQLAQSITDAGATFTNFQNLNIYQTSDGSWHMALAIGVNNPQHPFHWTVIVHAGPTIATTAASVPTSWTADKVLVGSFAFPVTGNYDPKYFMDGGQLFLIYVKRVVGSQPARNVIVAQPMISPTEPEAGGLATLLAPDDANGGFNSELFDTVVDEQNFKVVEVANVAKINGKYALAYSVGKFNEANYKAGVAWSDTFLPSAGSEYKKVLQLDAQGVWGTANHQEVRYLLQSQKATWPNYSADQVIGPGVPSFVQGPQGAWFMFFGGFDPADTPQMANMPAGEFIASSRRPYFLQLKVAVPLNATVAATSNQDLAAWLTPMTRCPSAGMC